MSSEDDLIRNIITYKYQSIKSKLGQMEGRLREVIIIIIIKIID